MHQPPKKVQPPPSQFEKPAKERLIEAADKFYWLLGIRAAPHLIAQDAHTNMDTLVKYFGHGDSLAGRFIRSLIADAEKYWAGRAAEHPNDPVAQLREWLAYEEHQTGYMMEPTVLLSRSAAELFEPWKHHPLLEEIEDYWQAERRRVVGLCKAARLRDPLELADKLLLLVHGARNERGAYGSLKPSRLLVKAGHEMMMAHGAPNRPASDHAPDLD